MVDFSPGVPEFDGLSGLAMREASGADETDEESISTQEDVAQREEL